MRVEDYFRAMVEMGASDLFLRANATPRARIDGVVTEIADKILTVSEMKGITDFLLGSDVKKKNFKENKDIEFIYFDETGRFRINMFTQRGTAAIVARHVHTTFNTFEELNLPVEFFNKFCEESKGLFLVCGPAGSGKSTSIASLIETINANFSKHIVTIEDPIEFLFTDKKSIINQRELGLDVPSYPSALRSVTQQSPDIIYIGNTRDIDTMKAAITATELGTFVITTFHTVNAIQTIVRMVNFFPPYLHDEVRMQLSLILKGVISIRLVPLKDQPGRIPACETMTVTPTISRLIREGKVKEIQTFIDEGELFGMQSFKKSLVHLVKAGLVSEESARALSDSKDEFNLELKGLRKGF